MRQAAKLFLLASLLIPSFACQQSADQPKSTFAEILPEGTQLLYNSRLDTDQDGQDEWVVFYRFDPIIDDEGRSSGPIAVAVYRAEGSPQRDLHAYPLTPREESYLCECNCTARMDDVLSKSPGAELIISDNCGGNTTRATIFSWDPAGEYLARGHFRGQRVTIQKDVTFVDVRMPDRAQIAVRSTYEASGGTYYSSDCSTPESQEFILYPKECQDVTLSPYPDKIVLAFYHHYCDAQNAAIYFTQCGWDQLNGCADERCGCTRGSSEVTHVQVINCQIKDVRPNEAVVSVSIVCKQGQEIIDNVKTEIEWTLVRKDERWKLDNAEIISRQPWPLPEFSDP